MATFEFIYTSMSSAKRGAVRAKIVNPIFTKLEDGRIKLSEKEIIKEVSKKGRRATVSSMDSPVAVFKALFEANFGKVRRTDLVKMAVEMGISKNTAASYYQKLYTAKK